jgi:Protein of unknown function (DUF2933)
MQNVFPYLLVLACPLGMAMMMIFMGKGMKSSKPTEPVSLAELKSEQERLNEQIGRLEHHSGDDEVRVPAAHL